MPGKPPLRMQDTENKIDCCLAMGASMGTAETDEQPIPGLRSPSWRGTSGGRDLLMKGVAHRYAVYSAARQAKRNRPGLGPHASEKLVWNLARSLNEGKSSPGGARATQPGAHGKRASRNKERGAEDSELLFAGA